MTAEAPSRHGGSTRISGTSSLLVSSLAKTNGAQYSCREPLTRPDLVLHFNDAPTDGIMFAHLREEPASLVRIHYPCPWKTDLCGVEHM